MLTRRQILAGLGSSILAIGFDPTARRWISLRDAQASSCNSFSNVPSLTGTLHLDLATRSSVSRDEGNLIDHGAPCAVLRPGNAEDVRRMVEFCRANHILVSARGQGHTTFGQSLGAGLVIEMGSLGNIHSMSSSGVEVDAGVRLKDLIPAAFAQGLAFPALPGFLGLSVGGVLSMAGISGRTEHGALVDNTSELEVVTGTGHIQRCSMQTNRPLFEGTLAGLGQCGIITRAKLDVVPAKPLARTYLLHYTSLNMPAFFRDFRTLAHRGEHDMLFTQFLPNGTALVPQINAVKFYDPSSPPNDAHQMRGLSMLPLLVPHTDLPYLVFIFQVDLLVDALALSMNWHQLSKPWLDVWLPESQFESYAMSVLPKLSLLDVGPGGLVMMFPQRRSKLTRPLFRVPDDDGSDFVYLLGILTASLTPNPGPSFTTSMLARNRRLYDQARAVGGTRYPHCAIEFTKADWVAEYGTAWPDFQQRKHTFDPDNILTPGPGIF